MKTLFPKQQKAVESLLFSLQTRSAALDASETGTGKTLVAIETASRLKLPTVVVCPKAVIPHWQRELEEAGVDTLKVINYDMLKRGISGILKRSGKSLRWDLPSKSLIIWDEAHNCRSPWTLNSRMLIASRDAGHANLLLSASPFEGPHQMRAIGYVLGLHTLFQSTLKGGLSWEHWMRGLGCQQDFWKRWGNPSPLGAKELHERLYHGPAPMTTRLLTTDMPSGFRKNHIYPIFMDFGDSTAIENYYRSAGIPEEALIGYIETGDASLLPDPDAIVQLLRARQQAEIAKVSAILSMAENLRSENKSIAIFVNFDNTVTELIAGLSKNHLVSVVRGGQSAEDRQSQIDAFQKNQNRIIVVNAAAGGTGVSLHDVDGKFPRVSLISPSFSATVFKQVLGRIYRNGMTSDATQIVLLAADTIEEKVYHTVNRKIAAMESLIDKVHPQ